MSNEAVLVPKGPDPVSLLLGRIPEFRDLLDAEDLDLPYVVYGFFAQYLLKLPESDPILDRAAAFVNDLAESGNADLENLVQVAVFEPLAGDAQSTRIKDRLRGKAMSLFLAAENMPGNS